MECLISYYCAPDGKFEAKEWTALLTSFEIPVLPARFLFVLLSKWRGLAMSSVMPTPVVTIGGSPAAISAVTSQTHTLTELPRKMLLDDVFTADP